MLYKNKNNLPIFIFLFVYVLTSCVSESNTNPYHLTSNVRTPPPAERTWIEPSFAKIATVSRGNEYRLIRPQALHIGQDGDLYVFDFGDHTVKRFSRDGTYRATYGNGAGRGPGQMMGMLDRGIWRDSLVYVVDGRQRTVLFFDRESGRYVRSERYDIPISRLAYAADSLKFVEAAGPSSDFLIMTTPSRQRSVSRVLSRDIRSIALSGLLHAYQGRAVYVPSYFPVVLSYALDDTTGIAYPTPDYGDVPPPEPRSEHQERRTLVYPPSNRVHAYSELIDGVLSIQLPNMPADSIAFDLYDADDMGYLHTVRFPIRREPAVYGDGLVATSRDTTVHLYRVDHSPKVVVSP